MAGSNEPHLKQSCVPSPTDALVHSRNSPKAADRQTTRCAKLTCQRSPIHASLLLKNKSFRGFQLK
jgi:hypothetical protein